MSKSPVINSAVPAAVSGDAGIVVPASPPLGLTTVTPEAPQSQIPINSPPIPIEEPPAVVRKRGRPAGSTRTINPPLPGAKSPLMVADKFRPAAESTVLMMEAAAVGLISDEWKFRDDAEKNMLIDATEKYFRSANIPDIPPGLMLIAMFALYAAPRLSMPQTQQKISRIKGKFTRAA